MAYQNTSISMTYSYQTAGSVYMQIGFSLAAEPDVALTMTYSWCWDQLMGVVDSCDDQTKNNLNDKHAGTYYSDPAHLADGKKGNDGLFYIIDPNRGAPGQEQSCGNVDYRLPWPSNTVHLDVAQGE